MSLYQVQKFLFQLNRDPARQQAYLADRDGALAGYELTAEERDALGGPDIGFLYHLGVNGQILMYFATSPSHGPTTSSSAPRDRHLRAGPRGCYAMTGYEGVDNHTARLRDEAGSA